MPSTAFCRTLKPGMAGGDVIAHKRAISHALPKTYPWYDFTPVYGPAFQAAVKEFQRQHAIPQTGVIGQTTHAALEKAKQKNHPNLSAFDSLAVSLARTYCVAHSKTPEQLVREAVVACGMYWYQQRAHIAYSQTRPFALVHPPSYPSRWDCSGFVTACHYAGGAPDPNGRNYDGQGYTGTLKNHGERVSTIDELAPADLIFYGYSSGRPGFNRGDPTHVALYVGDRMVVSMGHYPMSYYRFDYRTDINHYRHYTITGGAL